jgi:hypothetical protein
VILGKSTYAVNSKNDPLKHSYKIKIDNRYYTAVYIHEHLHILDLIKTNITIYLNEYLKSYPFVFIKEMVESFSR